MPSSRLLIVNADDFGLSHGVNAGVIEAHVRGIVTSASLMVRPASAAEAVQLAQGHPRLSVGLHLDLCEWSFRDGTWQLDYEVAPLQDSQALECEVLAQLRRFEELTGRNPSHLDSHQHVHRSEPLRSIILSQARRLQIPLRNDTPALNYTGSFYGQSNKGEPYPQGISFQHLETIIRTLPQGITELGCHPSKATDIQSVYLRERLQELQSLCHPRVRSTLESEGVRLCTFSDPEVQGLVRTTR